MKPSSMIRPVTFPRAVRLIQQKTDLPPLFLRVEYDIDAFLHDHLVFRYETRNVLSWNVMDWTGLDWTGMEWNVMYVCM